MSDFTITLTATDDASGVAETYYKINDGATQTVSADGQPVMTTEGADNTLEYWSADNMGNEETPQTLTGIKLDKTAPTGSITINAGAASTTSTSVTLTLTYTDILSGFHQVRYSNDGTWDTEQWQSPSATKTWTLPSGDGTKTVHYQIIDNAGNTNSYSDSINLQEPEPSPSPSPSLPPRQVRLQALRRLHPLHQRRRLQPPQIQVRHPRQNQPQRQLRHQKNHHSPLPR